MGRATLIDVNKPEDTLDDDETTATLETQDSTDDLETNQETRQLAEAISDADDDEIPEKYRGKSVKEIIEMHQNAEKHIGKQSSEVGELRKVVDDFIQGQLNAQKQNAPEHTSNDGDSSFDDVDFFVDPSSAIKKAIESHPAIRESKQYAELQKKAAAMAQLHQKHPDVDSVLKDEGFAEWIKASKVRQQLFARADQQYDLDSADELLSLWKERKQFAQQAATVDKQSRKNAVKNASTGSAQGSSEPSRKKIYRRADIIKLMKTDPQRYTALQDEIVKAYQEGRVK